VPKSELLIKENSTENQNISSVHLCLTAAANSLDKEVSSDI